MVPFSTNTFGHGLEAANLLRMHARVAIYRTSTAAAAGLGAPWRLWTVPWGMMSDSGMMRH